LSISSTEVAAARREKLSGNPPMLFHCCWHDAQTRQLRFSLVSAAHGRLRRLRRRPWGEACIHCRRYCQKGLANAEWGQDGPDELCEKPALSLAVFVAHLPPDLQTLQALRNPSRYQSGRATARIQERAP
jgi:hypothetical protein